MVWTADVGIFESTQMNLETVPQDSKILNPQDNEGHPEGALMSGTASRKITILVILSAILGASVGFALSYAVLQSTTHYIHSQLLHYPPEEITAHNVISGWILNWTPTRDVRIIRVQVWMGNPANVTWEGDTYVTVGKPDSPANPNSYNDTIQLLVHYQFDSHAPSSIPHQLMFDLTPGFKVASGQTINVWRAFVNGESRTVTAGDVQVIIYYEHT